jgi:uncharacterized protein (TIGR00251 family)
LRIIFMGEWFRVTGDSIYIEIRAVPGASKNEIAGIRDGRLCVRIAAAPEDGRANASLREFLAKVLDCAKRDVVLTRGEKSRLKTVAVPPSCEFRLREIDERI